MRGGCREGGVCVVRGVVCVSRELCSSVVG